MCLAFLFDLFCPLLETVVCLFWGEGGGVDLVGGRDIGFRVSFGFGFFFSF